MKKWKKSILKKSNTIRDAISTLDAEALRIVIKDIDLSNILKKSFFDI